MVVKLVGPALHCLNTLSVGYERFRIERNERGSFMGAHRLYGAAGESWVAPFQPSEREEFLESLNIGGGSLKLELSLDL